MGYQWVYLHLTCAVLVIVGIWVSGMSTVPCICQITFTGLNFINCKTSTILHHPYCCCVHTHYNLFAHSSCTSLFILLFIKSTVCCIAHFTLLHILLFIFIWFYLYLYIYSCVVLLILRCPLSGPDLIYISLRIIFCIIVYVTNKEQVWNDMRVSDRNVIFEWTVPLNFEFYISTLLFTDLTLTPDIRTCNVSGILSKTWKYLVVVS